MKRFIKWAAFAIYAEFIFHVIVYAAYIVGRIPAPARAFASAKEDMCDDFILGSMELMLLCSVLVLVRLLFAKLSQRFFVSSTFFRFLGLSRGHLLNRDVTLG